jgi:hypothetical protein
MTSSRNTSISIPACFGPWIRIYNIRYFFYDNHVGMLCITRMIGHVLCTVLFSPNGFIPSVLKANHIFHLFATNFGYWRPKKSTEFHPQGVESPHHFPYASQNTNAPFLHPYGWRTHISNDRSLEGTTSPRQEFSSSSCPLYQDRLRHQHSQDR